MPGDSKRGENFVVIVTETRSLERVQKSQKFINPWSIVATP